MMYLYHIYFVASAPLNLLTMRRCARNVSLEKLANTSLQLEVLKQTHFPIVLRVLSWLTETPYDGVAKKNIHASEHA